MNRDKITSAQLTVWIVTALSGPLVFFSDGNWVGALLTAFITCVLSWVAVRYGRHWDGPVYAFAQILWIVLVLSQLSAYYGECWPTGKQTFPLIPLTILAFAGFSSVKGDNNTANGISVLFWIAAALLGAVILFGTGDMDICYLAPQSQSPEAIMVLILLLPAVAGFLNKERCAVIPFVVVAVMAVGISVWIAGTLSPEIAGQLHWPFYEAAKSVQLLDIAKRFEALVSVGVTVGNYALSSLLFCVVGTIAGPFGYEKRVIVLSGIIVASLMLLGFRIDSTVSVIISAVLWLFLPLLGLLKPIKKE